MKKYKRDIFEIGSARDKLTISTQHELENEYCFEIIYIYITNSFLRCWKQRNEPWTWELPLSRIALSLKGKMSRLKTLLSIV